MPELAYRPELDGLRAIAVLSVILYYAKLSIFSGGFIGVDVFFVISGYLISRLLLKEISSGDFSFKKFYIRRIRRLIPAISFVLLLTSIWAFFSMDAQNYEDFGKSLLAVSVLSSNWFFLHDSLAYFSPQSESSPLLHTWSLGIEEQFYLLYPLLLVFLLHKAFKKNTFWIIASLTALSFIYSLYLMSVSNEVNSAFFNSAARFWEILVGCLLAFNTSKNSPIGKRKKFSNGLAVISIIVILACSFFYTKQTPFPGISASIPVIAALLFIALSKDSTVGEILCSSFLRYIGKLSYSLYLWHWPVLIAAESFYAKSQYWTFYGLATSLILSVFTYHVIENPIRSQRVLKSTRALFLFFISVYIFFILVIASALIPVINYERVESFFGELGKITNSIHKQRGLYLGYADRAFDGTSGEYQLKKYGGLPCSYDYKNSEEKLYSCLDSSLSQNSFLVIGDSIGRDTLLSLKLAFPDKNFVMLHQSNCMPIEYTNIHNQKCFAELFKLIQPFLDGGRVKGIILSSRIFPEEVNLIINGAKEFNKENVPTLIIIGAPSFLQTIDTYTKIIFKSSNAAPLFVPASDRAMLREGQDKVVIKIRESLPNTMIYDAYMQRCNTFGCPLFIDDDFYRPIIFDREHLTLEYIHLQSRMLAQDKTLQFFLSK